MIKVKPLYLLIFFCLLTSCNTNTVNNVPPNQEESTNYLLNDNTTSNKINIVSPDPWEDIEDLKFQAEDSDFAYNLDINIPDDIRKIIVANRENVFKQTDVSEETINSLLVENYDADEDIITRDKYLEYLNNINVSSTISVTEAIEDVEYLFDLLKYYYGGYNYFGGNDMFMDLKYKIINDVKIMGESIQRIEFRTILTDYFLPALKDCHFAIDNTYFSETYSKKYFLFNEDFLFYKKENNYYIKVDSEEYLLDSVNGDSLNNKLYPYLTDNADITWIIGLPSNKAESILVDICLINQNTGNKMIQQVRLSPNMKMSTRKNQDKNHYIDYIDDIPIMYVHSMSLNEFEGSNAEEVKNMARTLRDEPVFIIDLRGNGGGYSPFPMVWTREYTNLDYYLTTREITVDRNTKTTNAVINGDEEQSTSVWIPYINTNKAQKIANDNLIIVLTDEVSASATEEFIIYLQQLENVMFIGTNTSGCYLIGGNYTFKLPNSSTDIRFGKSINLNPDFSSNEGIGLCPDIWTPSGDSLSRAILFIKNYSNKN